jgi:hypothetical protein
VQWLSSLPSGAIVGEEGIRSVQREHKAQELLGHSARVLLTERGDEVALRSGQMRTMGVVEVLDGPLPRPWPQRGRRWGGTGGMGLAAIRPAGDHRQGAVAADGKGLPTTRRPRRGEGRAPRDVREDRLRPRRPDVRQPPEGQGSARDGPARRMAVSPLAQDGSRGEAPTVSGAHGVTAGGVGPCGPRKDAPTRPPRTGRTGALDPLGRPVAPEGRAGAGAEDGVDLPRSERLATGRNPPGRLGVGAGQRRAWATRAPVGGRQPGALAPVPWTGAPAAARADGRPEGGGPARDGARERVGRSPHGGAEGRAAAGSAWERRWGLEAGAAAGGARVVGVRSPVPAARQAAGLATRRAPAAPRRPARPPARGRGQRPRPAAAPRVAALAPGRQAHRGAGVLRLAWAQPRAGPTPAVGRGRGAAKRAQRVTEPSRSPLPRLARRAGPLAERVHPWGGKALGTNAPHAHRAWAAAGLGARHASRLARLGHRLQSRGGRAPRWVTRADHSQGLTDRCTVGVRVGTVLEGGRRRSRAHAQAHRPGLHPDKRPQLPDPPTAARLLQALSPVSLPSLQPAAGEDILQRLTPWAAWPQDLLPRLGLDPVLSHQRAMHDTGKG